MSDPLYGSIPLTQAEVDVVDTPVFQRLRRVGVELGKEVLRHVKGLEGVSGRDIRNVLKLARFVCESEDKRLDVALFEFCRGYK